MGNVRVRDLDYRLTTDSQNTSLPQDVLFIETTERFEKMGPMNKLQVN